MRLYDTRMTRYLGTDTASKKNPYYFADKKKMLKIATDKSAAIALCDIIL